MDRKERIEREIQKTLQCFDQTEKIETNPFFYTRLQERIRRLQDKRAPFIQRVFSIGFLRPAFLILIVALNVFSLIAVLRNRGYQSPARKDYITAFADEYGMSPNGSYTLLTRE